MGLFDEFGFEGRVKAFKPSCGVSCHQCDHCNSPKLAHIASERGGVLFLADEPTVAQDKTGDVFTGAYITLLRAATKYEYPESKVSLCFANACRGNNLADPENKLVYQNALESCHEILMESIKKADPSIIIPLGPIAWDALKSAFTGRLQGLTFVDDLAFTFIPDQELRRWVAPCVHPLYIQKLISDRGRIEDGEFYKREYDRHLRKVFTEDWSTFKDYMYVKDRVHVCETVEEACSVLRDVLKKKPKYFAFDYETESLKMEREDLDIVCVGIAYEDDDSSYSFDWYKDNAEFISLFTQIMTDKEIGKIAHHAKYESRVTMNKLGVLPEPWAWDSMYGARVLNNKRKCGLKPQTYINFGVAGYDQCEWYFETPIDEKEENLYGNNRRNSFKKYYDTDKDLRHTALLYVGQDAAYSRMLSLKQMPLVAKDSHVAKGEALLRLYINALAFVEYKGMNVDRKMILNNMDVCEDMKVDAEKLILSDDLVKQWDRDYPFDYTKTGDLQHLLYDIGKCSQEYTTKGKLAVNSSTLELMPLGITDSILEARRMAKLQDTYLANMWKESVKDPADDEYKLHVNFNMHVAQSFRSSSSGGLNLQNLPTHSPRALELVKSCVIPPKGMFIVGSDYSALEIGIGCSLHHDKNMTKFLLEGGDMHRATTKDIYFLTEEEVTAMDTHQWKELRQMGKRSNFLTQYGGGAGLMASILWKDAQHNTERMDRFTKHGISNFEDFTSHVQGVHHRFWHEQFPEYGNWVEENYKFYKNHGYVVLPAGFKCHGPLTKMQVGNFPIQGSAAQLALFAGAHITEELRKRNMKSFVVNFIHDALYASSNDEELEELLALEQKWMIDEIYNEFPWVSVPLHVDVEKSALRENGGNWGQEETIRRLSRAV